VDPCDPSPKCGLCVDTFLNAGWGDPIFLWTGEEGAEPVCPYGHPLDWNKHGVLPKECPECTCEPSTGSCRLPTHFTAHAAPLCPATAASTPFDAPYMWDGSCTDVNPISVNKMCPPNGAFCVQSLSIAPLMIEEAQCAPVKDPTPSLTANPKVVSRACRTWKSSECSLPAKDCFVDLPPPGFSLCTYQTDDDEFECPAPYTKKSVFYHEDDGYLDERKCADCKCGTPMGDSCNSQISIYSNPGCSGVPFWSNPVTSGGCVAGDIMPPGAALMSKQATEPIYTPGMCEPFGGYVYGPPLQLGKPTTVCCLP
jgi:hypothetical protein